MADIPLDASQDTPLVEPGATPSTTAPHLSALLVLAAGSSIVAGVLHYAAAADHRHEWTLAAVVYTAVGAFQLVWPAWLVTDARRRVLVTGAAVNAAALALWALSRTTGLPIGHDAGVAEAVGRLDAAVVLAEAAVVAAALVGLRRETRTPASAGSRP